jgi:sterol desaturase/sphingolipid hydroxylase (fatty acid hydroxylase superfamily)
MKWFSKLRPQILLGILSLTFIAAFAMWLGYTDIALATGPAIAIILAKILEKE